jgi:hypothetical protein
VNSAPTPAAAPTPLPPQPPPFSVQISKLIALVTEQKADLHQLVFEHACNDLAVASLLKSLKSQAVTSTQLTVIFAGLEKKAQAQHLVICLYLAAYVAKLPQSYIDALGGCVTGKRVL